MTDATRDIDKAVDGLVQLHQRLLSCFQSPTGYAPPRRPKWFVPTMAECRAVLDAMVTLERLKAATTKQAWEDARQIAFDQQCDSPEHNGDWNDACLHITEKLEERALARIEARSDATGTGAAEGRELDKLQRTNP